MYKIMGFYPHDISHYKTALMHKSARHKNKKGRPVNNERLEFLGDAVLDAVAADIVFSHFKGKREGFLTNTRSKLVQRETLNKLSRELGIGRMIFAKGHTPSHNSYIEGNAFEALVGAMYLDRGYGKCLEFMEKRILGRLVNIDKLAYKEVNFKSKLLEWGQKNRIKLNFKTLSERKDANESPIFGTQVVLEGIEGCAAEGYSKKESQQLSAKLTLDKLRKDAAFIDEVFAAKGDRTKMEEEPVQIVPDMEAKTDFIINGETAQNRPVEKHENAFKEQVFDERQSAQDERHATVLATEEPDNDFDLSDITARARTREDIIAAAEAKAFRQKEA